MKLHKHIVLLLFVLTALRIQAQQDMILKPLETDSASIELERQIEYRQMISGVLPEGFLNKMPEFPKFDFKSNFSTDYTFNFSRFFTGGLPVNAFSLGSPTTFFSPFYGNATVLSQGMYQINSKFSMGGYSYGVNSPFSSPLPNAFEQFDRYGSTFFMQYKVSKNFKIETRVNVSQGGTHPGF